MPTLKGSKTHENLKAALATEAVANRRYLHFAHEADADGYPEVAGLFRDTAEAETAHAMGHLEYLKDAGDPVTGLPMGDTASNLKAAIVGESDEAADFYPAMAKTAREEGFTEIAEWFQTLAEAERNHSNRFTNAAKRVSAAGQ